VRWVRDRHTGRVPVLLLDDDDVRARLDPSTAVRAVREALIAAHSGQLHSPPRVAADLGGGNLVFTAGLMEPTGVFGFRAYDTLVGGEQLVAVWGQDDGRLRVLICGDELGARRTGAIGAVAVDVAARPGAIRLGLVGAGTQAWTQLWAIRAVRPVVSATVAARRPERAAAFAERAAAEMGVTVRRSVRLLLLYDRNLVVVARTTVPVRDITKAKLDRLHDDLAPVFGKGWME